jgi:hypothetical protein
VIRHHHPPTRDRTRAHDHSVASEARAPATLDEVGIDLATGRIAYVVIAAGRFHLRHDLG